MAGHRSALDAARERGDDEWIAILNHLSEGAGTVNLRGRGVVTRYNPNHNSLLCTATKKYLPLEEGWSNTLRTAYRNGWRNRKGLTRGVPLTGDAHHKWNKEHNPRTSAVYGKIAELNKKCQREKAKEEPNMDIIRQLEEEIRNLDRVRRTHRKCHKDYSHYYPNRKPLTYQGISPVRHDPAPLEPVAPIVPPVRHDPAPEVPAPAPEVLDAHDELEEDLRTIFSTDSDEEVVA